MYVLEGEDGEDDPDDNLDAVVGLLQREGKAGKPQRGQQAEHPDPGIDVEAVLALDHEPDRGLRLALLAL